MNHVRYEIAGGVGTVTLARPDVGNALDLATAHALSSAVDTILADPDAHVVLLQGEGPHFCVGGDVRAMAAQPPEWCAEVAGVVHDTVHALHDADRMVVAAVQGAVAGGGLGLALAADVVVAMPSTRFVPAWGQVGLTPDGGATWLLPRRVGPARAAAMLLDGRVVTGVEALEWGLATELVPDDVHGRAADVAASYADTSWRHRGTTRLMLRRTWDVSLGTRLAEEAAAVGEARRRSGPALDAFLRRRAARPTTASRAPTESPAPSQVRAPFHGTATVFVAVGDSVRAGDRLAGVEAMKMDALLAAPHDGTVEAVSVTDGEDVDGGDVLLALSAPKRHDPSADQSS